jgi:phosphatidylglycerophosphate synthase
MKVRPAGAVPLTEGERWTRRRLEELRGAGFGPLAVGGFLAASHRRAAEERRARPALARQANAWSAVGALAWLALAASGRGEFRARLRSGLASWGGTSLMLSWHLGMVETEDGRPRRLGPADACTLVRAWLIPLAAGSSGPAVFALAVASDGLDGALARTGRPTRFGRDLDAIVDAAFAAAALRGAARTRSIGRGTVALEGGRLAAASLYTARSYFIAGEAPDRARARAGRIATPVRAAGMIAAAAGHRRAAGRLLCAAAATNAAVAVRMAGWKSLFRLARQGTGPTAGASTPARRASRHRAAPPGRE